MISRVRISPPPPIYAGSLAASYESRASQLMLVVRRQFIMNHGLPIVQEMVSWLDSVWDATNST